MDEKSISRAVINRLPRYYRYLGILLQDKKERISSGELSRMMNVTASQIRQDLNHFGGFGQQGYGYNVEYLHTEIGKILGLDQTYTMIIIGAGRLGQAIAGYVRFEKLGFQVTAVFDSNPDLIGRETVHGMVIRSVDTLADYLRENHVDIAALTLPTEGALQVAPILADGKVRGIWNFAHTDLDLPESIAVQSVHLSESLMQLSYKVNHNHSAEN